MHPLLILLLGMVVVLVGIMYFRSHAFLSLIAAALTIAVLTSTTMRWQYEVREVGIVIADEDLQNNELTPAAINEKKLLPQSYHVIRDLSSDDGFVPAGSISLVFDPAEADATLERVDSSGTELLGGDRLISFEDYAGLSQRARRSVGQRVADGFGDTCEKIGILIAMAAIIGHCLLRSGGAQRIIQATCSLVGDSRASMGFVVSGFVLGIPVFFDTVFYLLIPLAKALYGRTGKNYLLYVMSIIVGATMAHSLVPPTPGPLLVASELKIDLGAAIKAGLVVGAICSIAGYLFARFSNRRWSVIPDPEAIESALPGPVDGGSATALPSLWLSLLPVLLPLVLLTLGADWQVFAGEPLSETPSPWSLWRDQVFAFAADKNIALTLSAAVALLLLAVSPRRDETPLAKHVQHALADAGSIILITAAGGALGQVIRETGIAGVLVDMMPSQGAGLLVLFVAFFVTMLIRFVQGSATVAMITAVGIVAPMATSMKLPFDPVYLFLAIGCGSKPLPWMNDSGFWVIGRLSGMTPAETLRSFSATLTVMGFVGFGVTLVGAVFWPS